LYEAQNKVKKYAKEKKLLGWNDVAVWKDFRLLYISNAVWAE
jgi:hypothetical protein